MPDETSLQDSAVLSASAELAASERRWPTALVLWNEFERLKPDSSRGLVGMAEALQALGRATEAEELLLGANSRFPSDPTILIRLARLAERRRDWQTLRVRSDILRDQFPNEVAGYTFGARALKELGKFDEAEAVSAEATTRFVDSHESLQNLAQFAARRQDWKSSLERWAIYRTRFPNKPSGYAGGAEALIKLNLLDESKSLLSSAEMRFPDDFGVILQLARSAEAQKDYDAALTYGFLLRRLFPPRPGHELIIGNALAALGRFDEAEAVLNAASTQWPNQFQLEFRLAELATEREDYILADARWQTLLARYPDRKGVRRAVQRNSMWMQIAAKQPESGGPPAMPAPVAVPLTEEDAIEALDILGVADSEEVRKFFFNFQNLGGNCEFGLVQRHFGAEPLGLLRWTGITPEQLTAAMEARLVGIGDPAFTVIKEKNTEYVSMDLRWGMFMHTFIYSNKVTIEKMKLQHLRRLVFLRDKLLEDLQSNEKLFVYVPTRPVKDIVRRRLAAALRRCGPTTLLWIELADASNPPGSVRFVDESLIVGYLDHYGNGAVRGDSGGWNISFRIWLEICRDTFSLWKKFSGKSDLLKG